MNRIRAAPVSMLLLVGCGGSGGAPPPAPAAGDGGAAVKASAVAGPATKGALAVRDVTGDGEPDVVVSGISSVSVLPGLGTGALGPATTHPVGGTIASVAIADLDLRNLGDGGFEQWAHELEATPQAVLPADLDQDGRLDLLLLGSEGVVPLFTSCAP